MTPEAPAPRKGQLALDTRTEREGIVMAEPGTYSAKYWLRPEGGGLEWEAEPDDVKVPHDTSRSS